MNSALADAAELALVKATQDLSPEERIDAFLVHSRLVMKLYDTGRQMRAAERRAPP